jgi:hypothetical protein
LVLLSWLLDGRSGRVTAVGFRRDPRLVTLPPLPSLDGFDVPERRPRGRGRFGLLAHAWSYPRVMKALVTVAAAALVFGVGVADAASGWRLPRTPYIGLHCDNAHVRHCEQVGLAVWVAQPARSVSARLDSKRLRLYTRAGGSGSYRKGMFWQMFFHDSHAQAWADASRSIRVRVTVVARDGSTHTVRPLVYVSEGYG